VGLSQLTVRSLEITGNGSQCSYLGANESDQVRMLVAYKNDYEPGPGRTWEAHKDIFGNVMEHQ
jgi:hypothetical protein